MDTIIHRFFSNRLLPISSVAETLIRNRRVFLRHPSAGFHNKNPEIPAVKPLVPEHHRSYSRIDSPRAPSRVTAGWFLGLGEKKGVLPEIVKAGDPVLHEPARDVDVADIGSEKIERIIEEMIGVMRNAPGVGLAAPQIGIPLKIIVLEDTKEYISYCPKNEIEAQDRRPFDLLVILNPKLKKKSNKTALFFEGCLRYETKGSYNAQIVQKATKQQGSVCVDGFRAVVERHLEVEVTGLGRDGRPIKVDATGWQARILQHECDHLDGTIYVDKIVPRTFRSVQNLDLPLPTGCPKLGVR